ncbi:MAG TPA: hypothetical protein VFP50_15455 [Anaeromyxobacteraceae bacterium]|nr:hypothetical protein [Anaeromyxobacteraceae bacterium]
MRSRFPVWSVGLLLLLLAGLALAQGFQSGAIQRFVGPITIDGLLTVTGYVSGRDAGFNNVTATGDVTMSQASRLGFAGVSSPGAPCFTYGGASTVQTCSATGFASLGAFQAQSTADIWDSLRNSNSGANCSGAAGAVCVNDTGGFAVADGSGTTVAQISAAGTATLNGGVVLASGATRQNVGSCDTRATTSSYPQVCDQVSGHGRIAGGAGATAFDINNAKVLAASAICRATLDIFHAGCTAIYCSADAGNMTFSTNANCTTTAADFSWTLETNQ